MEEVYEKEKELSGHLSEKAQLGDILYLPLITAYDVGTIEQYCMRRYDIPFLHIQFLLQATTHDITLFTSCYKMDDEEENHRFLIELEFIQCLSNPWYLNNLAQQQYFKDAAFLNYLKYLMYWKKPEYAKFVVYPHALHFLDLLQHEEFREHIATSEYTQEMHRIQYYHWMFLRKPSPSSSSDSAAHAPPPQIEPPAPAPTNGF